MNYNETIDLYFTDTNFSDERQFRLYCERDTLLSLYIALSDRDDRRITGFFYLSDTLQYGIIKWIVNFLSLSIGLQVIDSKGVSVPFSLLDGFTWAYIRFSFLESYFGWRVSYLDVSPQVFFYPKGEREYYLADFLSLFSSDFDLFEDETSYQPGSGYNAEIYGSFRDEGIADLRVSSFARVSHLDSLSSVFSLFSRLSFVGVIERILAFGSSVYGRVTPVVKGGSLIFVPSVLGRKIDRISASLIFSSGLLSLFRGSLVSSLSLSSRRLAIIPAVFSDEGLGLMSGVFFKLVSLLAEAPVFGDRVNSLYSNRIFSDIFLGDVAKVRLSTLLGIGFRLFSLLDAWRKSSGVLTEKFILFRDLVWHNLSSEVMRGILIFEVGNDYGFSVSSSDKVFFGDFAYSSNSLYRILGEPSGSGCLIANFGSFGSSNLKSIDKVFNSSEIKRAIVEADGVEYRYDNFSGYISFARGLKFRSAKICLMGLEEAENIVLRLVMHRRKKR